MGGERNKKVKVLNIWERKGEWGGCRKGKGTEGGGKRMGGGLTLNPA